MKAYFTASTSGNADLLPHYTRILDLITRHAVSLTSGPQIISSQMLSDDKKLSSKEIFERQKKRIEESDFIIAETSKPSHGVGGEIVYALSIGKPVLALVHVTFEDHISPMVAGNPDENLFIEYYEEDSNKLPRSKLRGIVGNILDDTVKQLYLSSIHLGVSPALILNV